MPFFLCLASKLFPDLRRTDNRPAGRGTEIGLQYVHVLRAMLSSELGTLIVRSVDFDSHSSFSC